MTTTKHITIAAAAALALFTLGAGTAHAFIPQPDPPSISHQVGEAGIGNPNDRVALGGPDTKVGFSHVAGQSTR